MYTTSTAFLEALVEAGVSYAFVNLGSDHPGMVEAYAKAVADGTPVPRFVTCPNEMVALSIAHGHVLVSGQAQAVIVHVECGTQALAGAMHNAAKGRAPVLVFAGASPFTQEGEIFGSRNEFIQWIQDVSDQRGIVRNYVCYDNEIRTGANVKQLVHRAMQFAHSAPGGPVYLMGAREVMEAETTPVSILPAKWPSVSPAALPPDAAIQIAQRLCAAERPLIVTSYIGRNPAAVEQMIALCERVGIGVLESVPSAMNFPNGHRLYQGNQWNQAEQDNALAAADLVLVIDSDVPWIPAVNKPGRDATVLHIDLDPLKEQIPLWYIGAEQVYRADAFTALMQINAVIETNSPAPDRVVGRTAHYAAQHQAWVEARDRRVAAPAPFISAERVVAALGRRLRDNAIVINEAISNYGVVFDNLPLSRPGSIFASGGGSLGWHGGAAIGAKLANPDAEVIAFTGDGSYLFSVPSSVHWIARRYETPFLQIIFNNGGWKSPKLSTLSLHPEGYAAAAADIATSFDPPPDYCAIAVASGAGFGRVVKDPAELEDALDEALRTIRTERRSAVLDIWIEPA